MLTKNSIVDCIPHEKRDSVDGTTDWLSTLSDARTHPSLSSKLLLTSLGAAGLCRAAQGSRCSFQGIPLPLTLTMKRASPYVMCRPIRDKTHHVKSQVVFHSKSHSSTKFGRDKRRLIMSRALETEET